MQSNVAPFRAPRTAAVPSFTGEAVESIAARISAFAVDVERLAIIDGGVGTTYSQLERRSNQLATYLSKQKIGPEGCVALLMDRSADFIVAALAVLKMGGAYLPLDSATPSDRAATILSDAGVSVLITHNRTSADAPRGSWHTVQLDGHDRAAIDSQPTEFVAVDPPSDQLAYVIYTSGSTGRPKGVEITHGNLLNLIAWHQATFQVTETDRASQVAGLGFDAAGWEIWPHLTAGAGVYIADENTRRSPQRLHNWLLAEQITVSFVPTVLAEQILHMTWPPDAPLRYLLTGADTLHRRPIEGLPFTFVNNYGPTECTVVATSGIVHPEQGADGIPAIGRPILNTIVLILDESLTPVPPGDPGELCLGGALVGRGYRNLPELTASRFVQYVAADGSSMRIYRTGDRARLMPDGQIAFLGRVDDQVKIRGYRIELGEIISSIDRFPGIEASVVVVRDSGSGPALIAYLVAADPKQLRDPDLRDFLSARLPDYMIPSQFVAVAGLPLTNNGKVDTAALPTVDATNLLPPRLMALPISTISTVESAIGEPPTMAPNDSRKATESQIAGIVAGLLGQPSIGHDDNFFLIGGHSMLGVQIVARLRDAFGVKLTLRQLFTAPTVTALAGEVIKQSAGKVAAGK